MVHLGQRVIRLLGAVGLSACVSGIEIPNGVEIPNYPQEVEVPSTIGYDAVGRWDRGYYRGITLGVDEERIMLVKLGFQSYLPGKEGILNDGILVTRALTEREISLLNIRTRQDLAEFLEERCKTSRGYLGPNFLL